MTFYYDSNFLPRGIGVREAADAVIANLNSNNKTDDKVFLIVPRIVARVVRNGNAPIKIEFGYPSLVTRDREQAIASVADWSRKLALVCR